MSAERSMTAAKLLDVAEVERLALNPGDMVVLKYPGRLTDFEVAYIHERFKAVLPDTKIILLEDGMDLSVIKASA